MTGKEVFAFLISIATLFSVIFAAVTKEELQKQPDCNRSCEAQARAAAKNRKPGTETYPRCATFNGSKYRTMSKDIMRCYIFYCDSVKNIAHMGACKKKEKYPKKEEIEKRKKAKSPCIQYCSTVRGILKMCVATDSTSYRSMSKEKFDCLKDCGQIMELSHPGTCYKTEHKPIGPFTAIEAPIAKSTRELISILAHRRTI